MGSGHRAQLLSEMIVLLLDSPDGVLLLGLLKLLGLLLLLLRVLDVLLEKLLDEGLLDDLLDELLVSEMAVLLLTVLKLRTVLLDGELLLEKLLELLNSRDVGLEKISILSMVEHSKRLLCGVSSIQKLRLLISVRLSMVHGIVAEPPLTENHITPSAMVPWGSEFQAHSMSSGVFSAIVAVVLRMVYLPAAVQMVNSMPAGVRAAYIPGDVM